MNHTKVTTTLLMLVAAVLCFGPVGLTAEPMGTAFTYQGRLMDANNVADGLYDFQFKLFDADSNGNQLGADVNRPEVDVIDGYFTVQLNFNDVDEFKGDARWLQISVRPGDFTDPNVYTVLELRQEVTPTPYALYSKSSGSLSTSGDLTLISGSGNVDVGDTNGPTTLHILGNWRIYDATGTKGTKGVYPTDYEGASFTEEDGGKLFTTSRSLTLEPGNGNVAIGTAGNPATLHNYGEVRMYSKTAGSKRIKGVYPTDFDGASYGEPSEIEWDFGDNATANMSVRYTSGTTGSNMAIVPNGGKVIVGALNQKADLVVTGSVDIGDTNNPANLNNFGEVRMYSKTTGSKRIKGVYPTDFEGASYGEPSEIEWDFGDNATQNMSINYTSDGSGSNMALCSDGGKVIVGSLNKKSDLVVTGSVDIGDVNDPANLNNFGEVRIYSKTAGSKRIKGVYPVDFNGASYGEPSEIEWDFGDNATQNMSINYTSEGSGSNMAICSDGGKVIVGAINKKSDLIVTGKLEIGDPNSTANLNVTGSIGIGTTSPTEKLDVAGTARIRDINATGEPNVYAVVCDSTGKLWKTVSSQRYKTDVRNLDADNDAILNLRPVRFEWQTTGQQDVGLIAEEVEKVSKDLVIYDGQGRPDGVKYDKVAVYLLSVIKNQQKENEDIKNRLASIESMMSKLSVQQEGGIK